MSCVETSIEYLAKIPLYDYEKPFLALTRLEDGHDPDKERLSNLAYETHTVRITDIRSCHHFQIDEAGFEVLKHPKSIENLNDIQGMHNYKLETEQLLTSFFKAVKVICWDFRVCSAVPALIFTHFSLLDSAKCLVAAKFFRYE